MNNNNNNARDSLSNEIPLSFPDMNKQPLTKASGGTMIASKIGSMNDTANDGMDMLYTSSKTKNIQNTGQSSFSLPYKRMEDIIQIMPESKANTSLHTRFSMHLITHIRMHRNTNKHILIHSYTYVHSHE